MDSWDPLGAIEHNSSSLEWLIDIDVQMDSWSPLGAIPLNPSDSEWFRETHVAEFQGTSSTKMAAQAERVGSSHHIWKPPQIMNIVNSRCRSSAAHPGYAHDPDNDYLVIQDDHLRAMKVTPGLSAQPVSHRKSNYVEETVKPEIWEPPQIMKILNNRCRSAAAHPGNVDHLGNADLVSQYLNSRALRVISISQKKPTPRKALASTIRRSLRMFSDKKRDGEKPKGESPKHMFFFHRRKNARRRLYGGEVRGCTCPNGRQAECEDRDYREESDVDKRNG